MNPALAACLALPLCLPLHAQELRIAGAPSAMPVLKAAAEVLKTERGYQFKFDTEGGGDAGMQALGNGDADIAVIVRPVTGDDRAQFPDAILIQIPIGAQATAVGVAPDVWDAGVHSISKETMQAIYELKLKEWNEAGGARKPVVFLNFEEGHGTWEMLAAWLYGDTRKAPLPKVRKVTSNSDAQSELEFTPGSIAPISPLAADGVRCHALAIQTGPGQAVAPTAANIANGSYPMARPINLVVNGRPTLAIRAFTEFMTGPKGQEILKQHGMFGVDATTAPTDNPSY